MKKLSFLNANFQIHFKMSLITEYQYVKLCDTKMVVFEYKVKFEKRFRLLRSEIGIFDIYFKRLYEESFEDLQWS